MPRPLKYKTADDLLDHCQIHDDCYLWPESSCSMPMLGPASPMAVAFGTSSVVRILFVICKYIPYGRRLVRKCNSDFCVNPYHYTESRKYMVKRAKLRNPNGLFPQQEAQRESIAPPDEVIESMRPKNPLHIKRLMDAAVIAGFDGNGLPDHKRYVPPQFRLPNYAGEDPVLVIKGFEPAAARGAAKPITDSDWDDLERPFRRSEPLPEVLDETSQDVEHPDLTDDIFEMIRRRKEWEANNPK